MKGIWSSLECIADWKRRLIFFALIAGCAGMLWQTHNLIEENKDHPLISPEASILNMRLDENGDPYATRHRSASLPYAKIWSSPITQACLAFVLAIVVGSLFRSLIRGALSLLAVISFAALLVGRENLFEMISQRDGSAMIEPGLEWLKGKTEIIRQFIGSSLHSTLAAATGLVMGMKK